MKARLPLGSTRIPAQPWPMGMRWVTWRVAASRMVRLGPLRVETRTWWPSGVNLRRLAPGTSAGRVWMTFFWARSITEMVPSPALPIQSSLRPGEMSKPSPLLPTGMTVWRQSVGVGPGLLGGALGGHVDRNGDQ